VDEAQTVLPPDTAAMLFGHCLLADVLFITRVEPIDSQRIKAIREQKANAVRSY